MSFTAACADAPVTTPIREVGAPRTTIETSYRLSSSNGMHGGISFAYIDTEPVDVRYALSYYDYPIGGPWDGIFHSQESHQGFFSPTPGALPAEAMFITIYAYGSAWDPAHITIWTSSSHNTGPIGESNPVPNITVSCGGSTVTRGDSISCNAVIANRGATNGEVKWEFTPASGSGISGTITETRTDTTWVGRLVAGGSIRASVTWNGSGVPSNSVSVTASPRTWDNFQTPSLDAAIRAFPGMIAPTQKRTPWAESTFSFANPDGIEAVSAGPNKSLFYFESRPNLAYKISYHEAFEPGSPWRALQTGTGGKCGQGPVDAFYQLVRQHEGEFSRPSPSHLSLLMDLFTNATFDAKQKIELIVRKLRSEVIFARDSVQGTIRSVWDEQGNNLDLADTKRQLDSLETAHTCTFAFFP